jgi:hypothetical protein
MRLLSRLSSSICTFEIGRIRRFRSFADLDFSLRFDGVMSTLMSKVRDVSGERPSTVARRVGRGLSKEKAVRPDPSEGATGSKSVRTTPRWTFCAGVDEEAKLWSGPEPSST